MPTIWSKSNALIRGPLSPAGKGAARYSPQMQSAVFPSGKTALLSWQGSLPHEKGGLAAPWEYG